MEKFGIITHTSHPLVMSDGTVYNIGLTVSAVGAKYAIMCFPNGRDNFKNASIVAELPTRWKLHPGYMHSFGITDNFFVIVEQPLSLSFPSMATLPFANKSINACLKWFGDEKTRFYLIDRKSGKLAYTFYAETFFYFHIINQYEKNNHVVIDICCYEDPEIINSLYIDSMKNKQFDPKFSRSFRCRPLRYVMPLKKSKLKRFSKNDQENLVELDGIHATAHKMANGKVLCKPEILCNLSCDLPRFNSEKNLGKEYRHFYSIDSENTGALIKVDVVTKKTIIWSELNVFTSEPIFVPSPNAHLEDDGIILASMLWSDDENKVGLLVLDATTMKEIGRCVFSELSGPIPNSFHGWFAENKL